MEELTRALASPGWSIKECRDRHGASVLDWAAGAGVITCGPPVTESWKTVAGQLECLKLVIEWMQRQQLEVNLAELGRQDGRTAVHWAARNGRTSCLRWLCENAVELGVEIEGRTADGRAPPHALSGMCVS